MINCNPETVSTDYDTSDRLYFEPLTFEDVAAVLDNEKPDGILVQFGGQTPLKLARPLEAAGYPDLGNVARVDRSRRGPRPIRKAARRARPRGPAARRGAQRRGGDRGGAAHRLSARRAAVLRARRPRDGGRLRRGAPGLLRRGGRRELGRAPGADRPLSRRRRRARRGRALRRQRDLDRRRPAAHRGSRDPLGRLLLGAAAVEDPAGPARRDPRRDAAARGGPLGARPRQHPVRDPARQALRPRGQPARLADGAVRLEGDRRARWRARPRCWRRGGPSPALALPPERDPVDFFIKAPVSSRSASSRARTCCSAPR